MSWFWDKLPSFGKPDEAKCNAKKQAEDEKNKKMVADEDVRHKKALEDITASVECKPVPPQPPQTEAPAQMGGRRRKSKRGRRNKKKNTKRRR